MNLALQQCLEARGLDEALDRFITTSAHADRVGDKVEYLVMSKAAKVAEGMRDSLAKQAYDNLKLYFDGI